MGLQKKLSLKIGTFCVLILGLTILIVCCVRQNKQPYDQSQQISLSPKPDYSGFIQNWNQYAREYPAEFQLIGNRAVNSQSVVTSLKKWCTVFNAPVNTAISTELTNLREELGTTTLHKWEEFRDQHRQKIPLDINAEMQPEQLATALNFYLQITKNGKTPDYILNNTVATVVKMNSLCQYFDQEKDSLHRLNIDTIIHSCQGLSTKGKYPNLDALVR